MRQSPKSGYEVVEMTLVTKDKVGGYWIETVLPNGASYRIPCNEVMFNFNKQIAQKERTKNA